MVSKDLQQRVTAELEFEPRIDASKIGVTATSDGVVTLAGSVPSYLERLDAEAAAKRVYGVKAVANQIQVLPPASRADADIAKDAVDRLKHEFTVPADRIKVTVSGGWVKLEGDVEYHYQRTDAEHAVERVPGVKGVTNLISIKPVVKADLGKVREEIEDALVRAASLDARHINVRSSDHKVILEGHVRSWAEAKEAEDAAWGAPGVMDVENRLRVEV